PREHRTLLKGVGAINDVVLGDVNGDGHDEMIAACEDAHLRVVDASGKLLLDLATSGNSPLLSCWFGTIAGRPKVLCGALNGGLYAFDATGKLLWSTRNTHLWYGQLPSCYSLAVADFSGQGENQIAIGTHGGVSLYSATGEFLRFTQVYAHAVKPVQAVRFYDDKQPTLLVNTWGGGPKLVEPAGGRAYDAWFTVWGGSNVYLQPHQIDGETYLVYGGVNGTGCGHLLRSWQTGNRTPAQIFGKDSWYLASDGETTAAVVLDVNGDGKPEVISGNETGFLVAYSLSGERLWAKLVGTRPNQLLAADLNGDGKIEIAMAGEDPGLTLFSERLDLLGTWSPGTPVKRIWLSGGRLVMLTAANTLEAVALDR
ncbi:MAG: FG-GAP-like repeat-containing protein, partial [Bacteroidota bacterium]